jgi:hypothetical protein
MQARYLFIKHLTRAENIWSGGSSRQGQAGRRLNLILICVLSWVVCVLGQDQSGEGNRAEEGGGWESNYNLCSTFTSFSCSRTRSSWRRWRVSQGAAVGRRLIRRRWRFRTEQRKADGNPIIICALPWPLFIVLGQDQAGEGEGSIRGQQWAGDWSEEGDGAGGGQVQGDRAEQQTEDARRQPRHH